MVKSELASEMTVCLAYFISSHGFGHASRACAIMAAMHKKQPRTHFHIFTQTPYWFFDEALTGAFTYHEIVSDVGVAQLSPMQEDLPETLRRLEAFIPFGEERLENLARVLDKQGCQAVICDISPLGIAVGKKAGLPVVLIENFTWDWIYEAYLPRFPGFAPFIAMLKDIFQMADVHIQMAPVCQPRKEAKVFSQPASRVPRTPAAQTRQKLNITPGARTVLLSMGGIPQQFDFLERLKAFQDVCFIVPGSTEEMALCDNLALLPHHSDFYHPDLVAASDVVIGKAGYSTIAEAYHAGIPFGYVNRSGFREAEVLEAFIRSALNGVEIPMQDFLTGDWGSSLSYLLSLPRVSRRAPNGADLVADYLLSLNLGYNQ
ncbi:MAG: hypothetical protein HPY45_07625 [Anaerolineae bacterium]|nr:hypothetical protein [Anaerolineae bacterium]